MTDSFNFRFKRKPVALSPLGSKKPGAKTLNPETLKREKRGLKIRVGFWGLLTITIVEYTPPQTL